MTTEAIGQAWEQVMGPDSPLPKVADLDSRSYSSQEALVQDIIESMRSAGGCVIRHLLNRETLDEIEREARPYLDVAQPWNGEGICSRLGFLFRFFPETHHIAWQEISGHRRRGR